MSTIHDTYQQLEAYAASKELHNTQLSLPLVKELLHDKPLHTLITDENAATSLAHSLEAAKMLVDLHIPMPAAEEDLLIASALCHDLLKLVPFPDKGQELIHCYHLDPSILKIIRLVSRPDLMTESEKSAYYDGIMHNPYALLVTLADRSNLAEQLSFFSLTTVNDFIYEIRRYFLPMCTRAKQLYSNYHMPMTILVEKIRCLIDVTDIIASRYQRAELSYTNEILSLMEENTRLKGMIFSLEHNLIQ